MLRPRVIIASLAVFCVAAARDNNNTTSDNKVSYENYKVFRIIPADQIQVDFLNRMQDEGLSGYSFWKAPSFPLESVDLMVSPERLADFHRLFKATEWRMEVYIDDVQRLIDNENPPVLQSSSGLTSFDWSRYRTLDEINAWLDSLAEDYSDRVEVINVGKSYQGRTIKGVKLSYGDGRPGVFVEGGIHAREWISPATVTYLLNEFLTSNETDVRKLAESYDWYLVPSLNPDGYVYTHTKDRAWRKTMSKSESKKGCFGADPNRNWDFKWMVVGASNNPCSETYGGKAPFSEIETRTVSQFVKAISHKLFAYISFHSYSQLLMFPYGHTYKHLDNYNQSLVIAKQSVKALARRYGTKYRVGDIAETIYKASGSSLDWVKAKFKLPITYVYELRDTGRHGFLLPAEEIVPNGEEVLDSFVEMFKQSRKFGYGRKSS